GNSGHRSDCVSGTPQLIRTVRPAGQPSETDYLMSLASTDHRRRCRCNAREVPNLAGDCETRRHDRTVAAYDPYPSPSWMLGRKIEKLNRSGSQGSLWRPPRGFEQEPHARFCFVNPVLDKTRSRYVSAI